MSINHLKFIILSIFIFTTINKSFCQKNGIAFNIISITNVSIGYERYFLSHSSISVGYRHDYRAYDVFLSLLFGGQLSQVRDAHKAFFEYRFYLSKDAHLNNGFYAGYSFITGKNRIRQFNVEVLKVNSKSNVFKVGYKYDLQRLSFDYGISFSQNSIEGGIDSFGTNSWNQVSLKPDLISSHFEIEMGVSYMF